MQGSTERQWEFFLFLFFAGVRKAPTGFFFFFRRIRPGGVLRAPAQVYLQSISFLQALVALFSLATSVLFRLLYRARQSFRRGVESRCIGFRNFIVCLHFFSSSSARDSVVFTFVKSSQRKLFLPMIIL